MLPRMLRLRPSTYQRLLRLSKEADKDAQELTLGFNHRLGPKLVWSGGFVEDAYPETAPDFVISTYRAMKVTPERPETLIAFLSEMGQRPYTPGSPAGWPDTAAAWDGGDALLKRIEWAGAVGRRVGDRRNALELANAVLPESADERTIASIRNAESGAQAFALLLAAPEFQRR